MIPNGFAAWLTINRKCNLRCSWCYVQGLGFQGSMSLQIVKDSIAMLKGLNVRRVMLIGGEPTIHPDFITIVKMVRNAGFDPMIVTNSLAFEDESFLAEAVEAGIKGISTSIKASSPERYKQDTGVDAYARVMVAIRNIEAVKSGTMFHKLSVTICEGMLNSFNETIAAIIESGVEMVSFDLERPIIVDDTVVFDGFVNPQDMANFLVASYPKMEAMGIRFNIKIGIPFCLFPKGFICGLAEKGQIISCCHLNSGSGIIIDEQGRLLPCNHFCNNPLGSLEQTPTGEDYLAWRRQPKIDNFYESIGGCPDKRCVDCEDWKMCGGGCRMHWMNSGAQQMLPTIERG